jgi:hypothetical protein
VFLLDEERFALSWVLLDELAEVLEFFFLLEVVVLGVAQVDQAAE